MKSDTDKTEDQTNKRVTCFYYPTYGRELDFEKTNLTTL